MDANIFKLKPLFQPRAAPATGPAANLLSRVVGWSDHLAMHLYKRLYAAIKDDAAPKPRDR